MVISPLNALMASQVKELAERGIPAVSLGDEGIDYKDLFQREGKKITGIKKIAEQGSSADSIGDHEVINAILLKLGLPLNTSQVAVSNTKLNVTLLVRIMQQPQNTYADLLSLFPPGDAQGPESFPQTLIYVNSRVEAEGIQDFLHSHCPEAIPTTAFEFYHRHIDDSRKQGIQESLRTGEHHGIPTTDALGMGMDFCNVKRVVLWHAPRSFLSLVQKVGRCVCNAAELGKAILFVTKNAYAHHLAELDTDEVILEPSDQANEEDGIPEEQDIATDAAPTQPDCIAAIDAVDPELMTTGNEFVTTVSLPFPRPLGGLCCDNCTPENFPVETIVPKYPYPTRACQAPKSSKELCTAVKAALYSWREVLIETEYSRQFTVVPEYVLNDDVINEISARPHAVAKMGTNVFKAIIPWGFSIQYGSEVANLVADQITLHPDPAEITREHALRERKLQEFLALATKERQAKLLPVFEECYNAVYRVKINNMIKVTRGGTTIWEREQMCRPFISLPH
ncbi:DEAD (Asp-Glu-Ala-Asp) box polypeptide 59 [Paramarasmius palmivorus]|uniref:DNA 3'-5' helicase n=1 Tax=Paramarasmius palmivorus TaxID=297713 RepID=A0AAW0BMX7_9AGAR